MNEENMLLGRVLRLLTPYEIEDLTTKSEGDKRVSITDLLFKEYNIEAEQMVPVVNNHENILNSSKIEAKQENNLEIVPPVIISLSSQNEKEIDKKSKTEVEAVKVKHQEIERPNFQKKKEKCLAVSFLYSEDEDEIVVEEKVDNNVFILDEQRKMKKTIKKMNSQSLMGLYQKNASLDIDHEKNSSGDLAKSTSIGVLVNKRRS